MANLEHYIEDDIHPIDLVEHLAEHHAWEFDRIHDDQIAMSVEGQWRNYSITLAWSAYDETLRMICTFEMEPPKATLPKLYEALNAINDRCWAGAYTYWEDQQLMVYRYGLVLAGGGALLAGITQRVTHETGMPCYIAPDPLYAVAIGSGLALENIEAMRGMMSSPGLDQQ